MLELQTDCTMHDSNRGVRPYDVDMNKRLVGPVFSRWALCL